MNSLGWWEALPGPRIYARFMQRPIHLSVEGHEFPWLVGGSSWSSHLCALLPFNGPHLSMESHEFHQLAEDSIGSTGMKTVVRLMTIGGIDAALMSVGCGGSIAGRLRSACR